MYHCPDFAPFRISHKTKTGRLRQTHIKFSIAHIPGCCKVNYEYFLIFHFFNKNLLLSFAKIPVAFSEILCYNVDTTEREVQTHVQLKYKALPEGE